MNKRTKLEKARVKKGLSQEALAEELGVTRVTVNHWENALTSPYPYYKGKLCTLFGIEDPEELLEIEYTEEEQSDASVSTAEVPSCPDDRLARVPVAPQASAPSSNRKREDEISMIIKGLQQLDRREIIALLGQVPAFASIDISVLFGTTIVAPEEFLSHCQSSMNGCWYLLKRDGFVVAESILTACMPTLSSLATHLSPYQHQAALLAVEAKIIQGIVALHNLNYAREEMLYLEAVRFGELSGNKGVQAVPLQYLGWLYRSHFKMPEKGIHFLNLALTHLDSDALLQKSDINMTLSAAYAQDKETKGKALESREQARMAMPAYPELDPLYRLIDVGPLELDRIEGEMCLELHKHFPREGYAQKAYDVFGQGTGKQAIADRTQSEILICKADAARGIGDLHEYLKCLEAGVRIALQIGSQKRVSEAVAVLQKTPRAWRKEQKYQNLAKILAPGSIR